MKTIPLNNGHVAVDEVIAATKKIQVNINHHIGEFIKAQLNEAAARLK